MYLFSSTQSSDDVSSVPSTSPNPKSFPLFNVNMSPTASFTLSCFFFLMIYYSFCPHYILTPLQL